MKAPRREDEADRPCKTLRTSDPVLKDAAQPLHLSSFRSHLIRQEETIIFALIERAQFPINPEVYTVEGTPGLVGTSLLDHMLKETELVHARVRRFTSPDEAAFFPEVAETKPILPLIDFPQTIQPNRINVNAKIKSLYIDTIIPRIASPGSDPRTFGSTSVADIASLQALSKRIHYGKFIAEAKFQENTEEYSQLIRNNDAAGLMDKLTNAVVEKKVLDRVELKASTYGQDIGAANEGGNEHKVDPKVIRDIYEKIIIPMTKEVQVDYLLQRLNHPEVVCFGSPGSCCHVAAKEHFGKLPVGNLFSVDSIDTVFSTVLSNSAAYGVVPLECSKDGVVKGTKELLAVTNLKIIAEIFVKEGGITTRCAVLSKTIGIPPGGKTKTALCFRVAHTSGSLFKALSVFQLHNVNLCGIESCPSPTQDFTYTFLVELEGSVNDTNVKAALDGLSPHITFLHIIGCFLDTSSQPVVAY